MNAVPPAMINVFVSLVCDQVVSVVAAPVSTAMTNPRISAAPRGEVMIDPPICRRREGMAWRKFSQANGEIQERRDRRLARRIPDDLPEVAVGIAEVARVDPPRPLVR